MLLCAMLYGISNVYLYSSVKNCSVCPCDNGEIEANATMRACRIINDTINPPYFVSSSQLFDKYMGYVLFGYWGFLIVVNKRRSLKKF